MEKKINVCNVAGVVYMTDAKNGITISQMGRYHLLVKCKHHGNVVRVRSPRDGSCYEAVDITSPKVDVTVDPQVFLVSMDAGYIEDWGAELLILHPAYELIINLAAA